MEIINTKDHISTYKKRVGLSEEDYNDMVKASVFQIFGDKATNGINQLVASFSGEDDIVFDKVETKCAELLHNGWKNLKIKQMKRYYVKSRICSTLMEEQHMCVSEYKVKA